MSIFKRALGNTEEEKPVTHKALYGVFDKAVETYSSFFVNKNRGEALRAWLEAVNDNRSMISKYPEHFYLVEFGTINENTGAIYLHPVPEVIGTALEYKAAPKMMPDNEVIRHENQQLNA